MKVILNKCYGGFDVSDEAYELYAKKKGIKLFKYDQKTDLSFVRVSPSKRCTLSYYFTKDFGEHPKKDDVDWGTMLHLRDDYRTDETLIEVVEELGEKASGRFGKLVVVEIPDGMKYTIDEYDGIETLHEAVRTW